MNSYLARRHVRIQKGLLAARDKRMGVLNELIGAVRVPTVSTSSPLVHVSVWQVKFIKFFAWEDRWIQRVLDAREVELQWMIKCMSAPYLLVKRSLNRVQRVSTLCASPSSGRALRSWSRSPRSSRTLCREMSLLSAPPSRYVRYTHFYTRILIAGYR